MSIISTAFMIVCLYFMGVPDSLYFMGVPENLRLYIHICFLNIKK